MYLKSIEMTGFKSFAKRTKLGFKPGLMAIVGPNGCGKSNVCEAIRWVLGETSAKALRGAKQEDFIFSGTDSHKALGMAEVSITLGDCESALHTEFDEVTVTRRVFRSGDGQYLINKKACRLKDIQRLFMDTGVGTVSYSLLEQGHIDRILSARPEDRRDIFEEASGINKFKADRKEATRKLEHTEANLLRLDDVIREVKRQIGSLQRQAGKARRYKTLREEQRQLDLYQTGQRLSEIDVEISKINTGSDELGSKLRDIQGAMQALTNKGGELRRQLDEVESAIAAAIEALAQSRNRLDRASETIVTNEKRIQEYDSLRDRDTQEVEHAQRQVEEQRRVVEELVGRLTAEDETYKSSQIELERRQAAFEKQNKGLEERQKHRDTLRSRLVELESTASRYRNDRMNVESQERANEIRRERLAAEQAQMRRLVEEYTEREKTMQVDITKLQVVINERDETLNVAIKQETESNDERHATDITCTRLRTQLAALRGQLESFEDDLDESSYPTGARRVLDADNPLEIPKDQIIGTLADLVTAEPEYRIAFEAVLRAWADTIVVADRQVALEILRRVQNDDGGSIRMLGLDTPTRPEIDPGAGTRLIDFLSHDNRVATVVRQLVGNVLVVDALPDSISDDRTYVTRDGQVARGTGETERWSPSASDSNPVLRRRSADNLRTEIETTEQSLADAEATLDGLCKSSTATRERRTGSQAKLDECRHTLAMKEGEFNLLSQEATQARNRSQTVDWEIKDIGENDDASEEHVLEITRKAETVDDQIDAARAELEKTLAQVQEMERQRTALYDSLSEQKVEHNTVCHRIEHLQSQRESFELRLSEIEAQIRGRTDGLATYQASTDALTEENTRTRNQMPDLQATVESSTQNLQNQRNRRTASAEEATALERTLAEHRENQEDMRQTKSEHEIRFTEISMRRQNLLERVLSEYQMTSDHIAKEAKPDWKGDPPSTDDIDTRIGELRTKLDAMGPVNLVAIEEYQELEDRYEFLTHQQEDLVNAKRQLIELIQKINRTTSELFTATFNQINTNFLETFQKLFDGGTAKLVLVNDEDVLESGIEIIARPPGKRLQNVTLLSGGERTMTAVALLFAIYMIKPSPFCVLDELDAALDESNIGRFVDMVHGFLSLSQFLVVTHNQKTIAAADILYGITMAKNSGISQVVSMKLSDHDAPTLAEQVDATQDVSTPAS